MEYEDRHVVLVGRPNVGKSRLFNRILNKRISVVHDAPGVTRDVITAEYKDQFILMDTGGLGLVVEQKLEKIRDASEEAVHLALGVAQLILFVVDARTGAMPLDIEIAQKLRCAQKPVFLVINKIDGLATEAYIGEFRNLGFKDVKCVSAEHGQGMEELIHDIEVCLGPRIVPPVEDAEPHRISISFVGRPNVGKSSITNALLNSNRLIVSEIPGTTRDTIALDLDHTSHSGQVWPFRLHDTAGLRRKTHLDSAVEFFCSMRTKDAIAACDVVFLVLDAIEGITKQDKVIADEAIKAGSAMIILVNKWDHALEAFENGGSINNYTTEREFREAFEEALHKEFFFLPKTPVLFVSAKTKFSIERILRCAHDCHQRTGKKLSTGVLNRHLQASVESRPPRSLSSRRRFKLYYAVHVGTHPHRIRIFCNDAQLLEEPYKRYLLQKLYEHFDLHGCPIELEFTSKPPRPISESQPSKTPRPPSRGRHKGMGAMPPSRGVNKGGGGARPRVLRGGARGR